VSQLPPAPYAACPAYGFAIDPREVARHRLLLDSPGRSVPAFFLFRALPPAVRAVLENRVDPGEVRHAAQRLSLRRRPCTEEELSAHTVVEATGDLGFRRAVVLRLALRDTAGHEVAELHTTLTTGPATGNGRIAPPPAPASAGPRLLSWHVRVPRSLPERYADASGDDNPIHTDDSAARRAGLPGVVLQGMATLHLAATGLTDRLFDGDETRWTEVRTRFSHPVLPGDDIEFTAHGHVGDRASGDLVGLAAAVGGRPVLKDTWFTGAVA
jgi:acyl dehydratase